MHLRTAKMSDDFISGVLLLPASCQCCVVSLLLAPSAPPCCFSKPNRVWGLVTQCYGASHGFDPSCWGLLVPQQHQDYFLPPSDLSPLCGGSCCSEETPCDSPSLASYGQRCQSE
ncbi:hypothetical protein XENORESO_017869 [Xenotaenia resolanae]|uniref:Secreted protein n=1 Tax=Xenotaenia resolanae TaxID=208358 RepID=A0ABV0W1Y9_9TELE